MHALLSPVWVLDCPSLAAGASAFRCNRGQCCNPKGHVCLSLIWPHLAHTHAHFCMYIRACARTRHTHSFSFCFLFRVCPSYRHTHTYIYIYMRICISIYMKLNTTKWFVPTHTHTHMRKQMGPKRRREALQRGGRWRQALRLCDASRADAVGSSACQSAPLCGVCQFGWVKTNGIPFLGRCTTHFSLFYWGDVHWG